MRRYVEKFPVMIVILALALSAVSCKLPLLAQSEPTPSAVAVGGPPRVWFDAPLEGTSLPLAPLEVVYHAGGEAGFTQVELSINGEVKSVEANAAEPANEAAFQYTWQPPAPGSYIFGVRAQGKDGGWSDLARVKVTVVEDTPTPETEAVSSSLPTATQMPAPTDTVAPTSTSAPTATATPTLTPTSSEITFAVELSTDKAYAGACTPNEVEFEVEVSDPARVYSIVMFVKLENLASGEKSAWDAGTSFNPSGGAGSGKFERKITTATLLKGATGSFRVLYQLVATDTKGKPVQRSTTYSDLLIEKCP